jgi:hypothetical protein
MTLAIATVVAAKIAHGEFRTLLIVLTVALVVSA